MPLQVENPNGKALISVLLLSFNPPPGGVWKDPGEENYEINYPPREKGSSEKGPLVGEKGGFQAELLKFPPPFSRKRKNHVLGGKPGSSPSYFFTTFQKGKAKPEGGKARGSGRKTNEHVKTSSGGKSLLEVPRGGFHRWGLEGELSR